MSSFEPSRRKPARREDTSSVPAEHALWESHSTAVCRVSASGEMLHATWKFLAMMGVPSLEIGMSASDLLAKSGLRDSVTIESIPVGLNGETLWILLPLAPADDRSHVAFRLLHDSVAQSVAALAMNLFLVQQSGATVDSPQAEKILSASLELVEQCAKEVRGICRLLQRQPSQADLNCA